VQRRDLVVELLATLVEAAQVLRQRLLKESGVDALRSGVLQDLDRVEEPARVAIRETDQAVPGRFVDGQTGFFQENGKVFLIQGLQDVNLSP
jgi:hypothetical protein